MTADDSPFASHPEFIASDERAARSFNPISLETLTTKFSALLPADSVAQSSILDLGCCLGAAGHWALSYGADRYVGVEVQPGLATRARQLLRDHGDKAEIVEDDLVHYLDACTDESFDIVVAAGILHTFTDPVAVIGQLTRVAKRMVSVEASHPEAVRTGRISEEVAALAVLNRAAVNKEGGARQLVGASINPTRAAVDRLFAWQGFMLVERELLPRATRGNAAFALHAEGEQFPLRYFRRYVRGGDVTPTLHQALKQGTGRVVPWNKTRQQKAHDASHEVQNADKWTFDAEVAERFSAEARAHIPGYDRVIDLCVEIAQTFATPRSRIIDVGCATGETLERLARAGFTNLVGIDNAPAMLEHARARFADDADLNTSIELIQDENFPAEAGPFNLILANWTLHFIDERASYLDELWANLDSGGLLVLTEKTHTSDDIRTLYHDFKRKSGVGEQEIRRKELSLMGVLTPRAVAWYLNKLYDLGSSKVEIVHAELGFVSFLARK